jgi:hypothetical protein
MQVQPIEGKPVRFPPGKVEIRLDESHRNAYKGLYGSYQTILGGLPVFREQDFDGRPVKVSPKELEALNKAFANLGKDADGASSAFGAQESSRTRLFKRLQHLS